MLILRDSRQKVTRLIGGSDAVQMKLGVSLSILGMGYLNGILEQRHVARNRHTNAKKRDAVQMKLSVFPPARV